jgi:hypothetical protein
MGTRLAFEPPPRPPDGPSPDKIDVRVYVSIFSEP